MAIPGDTGGFHKEVECMDCKGMMPLQVCRSSAGYYLGYYCDNCGPWTRETDYYSHENKAQKDLDKFLKTGEIPRTRR